ncbi:MULTISPECIES: hypothetical protein [Sphingomonas]|jgi:hypothetical protein|uniref:hypothetical protein n=1 Tax=Sphingomonas TaxID=13687 RepID=UPI0011156BC6|nr:MULTISPECIES: hypothetical protein [Sphingomonas]
MNVQDMMRGYDYDLPLYDVLNNSSVDANGDPEISADRRVLAGATIGIGLDIAYLAITEMQEAFEALARDVSNGVTDGEGSQDLAEILSAQNPFQMRLWYLLYDTPFEQAHEDLCWLKSLTYRRGRMCTVVREEKLAVVYATNADLCESLTAAQLMANMTARD